MLTTQRPDRAATEPINGRSKESMPAHIKIIVSVITLAVGGAYYFSESHYGETILDWVGIGLSVFMVIAMWLFRESGRRN